ncbi:ferredoxin reductase family protein [Arcticibacter tournemirensis]
MKINIKATNYFFWGLALLVIPLSFFSAPEASGHHKMPPLLKHVNEIVALTGYSMLALSFVLSARIKWLERQFDGLDKMYQTHHKMAVVAFIFMLAHPFLLALRWIPDNAARFFLSVFPLHHRDEVNLGSYALWGIIVLMVFTLLIKLPYRIWKISHKFMGVFFIMIVIHTFHLTVSFDRNPLLWIYLVLISGFGIAAFIYQTLLFGLFNRGLMYVVKAVEKTNGKVLSVKLIPQGRELNFIPGQFCFFSFRYPGLSRESHPYTLCSGEGSTVQILVKSLGDYTSRLYDTLKPGAKVKINGPYGCFHFREGINDQVWIAGGVGIAPFVSWMNDLQLKPSDKLRVELYYCVNQEGEAMYLDEFRSFEQSFPGFKLHLICADKEGFLKVRGIVGIQEKEIFLCGPKAMSKSLNGIFQEMHIPSQSIHYENFDFS